MYQKTTNKHIQEGFIQDYFRNGGQGRGAGNVEGGGGGLNYFVVKDTFSTK